MCLEGRFVYRYCIGQDTIRYLCQSWRISALDKLTAYREAYKSSFPVHKKAEDILKVPSLDDIVEHFFIQSHSGKATFKNARTLFSHNWKDIAKLACKGQSAAQMGIIIILYIQQALASLLQQLNQESPKQMRFDNSRNYRSYGQNRPEYSATRYHGNRYKSAGSYGQRFSNQQIKGVSFFRAPTRTKS